MTDLTDVQRRELLRIAGWEHIGGVEVRFPTRVHRALERAGWLEVDVDGLCGPGKVRCTSEGLRVADELRDGEAA